MADDADVRDDVDDAVVTRVDDGDAVDVPRHEQPRGVQQRVFRRGRDQVRPRCCSAQRSVSSPSRENVYIYAYFLHTAISSASDGTSTGTGAITNSSMVCFGITNSYIIIQAISSTRCE